MPYPQSLSEAQRWADGLRRWAAKWGEPCQVYGFTQNLRLALVVLEDTVTTVNTNTYTTLGRWENSLSNFRDDIAVCRERFPIRLADRNGLRAWEINTDQPSTSS